MKPSNSRQGALRNRLFITVFMYLKSTYTELSWLPLALIRQAIEGKWDNSLCYLIWLRKTHNKPIFYNYSLRAVSDRIGCSPSTLAHHINILRSKGCISVTNGNLQLTGSSKLEKKFESQLVAVKYSTNKTELIHHIRFTLIKRNLHKQDKIITVKNNIIEIHKGRHLGHDLTKKTLKLEKMLFNNKPVENSICRDLVLSNRKFGELANRSQSTGVRIQRKFNQLGLIVSKRYMELQSTVRHNRRSFFEMNLPSCFQLSKAGFIYRVMPNRIVLT